MGSRSLQVPLDDPEAAAAVILAHDAVTPLDAVVAVDDRGAVAAALASHRLGPPPQPARRRGRHPGQAVMRLTAGAPPRSPSPPTPPVTGPTPDRRTSPDWSRPLGSLRDQTNHAVGQPGRPAGRQHRPRPSPWSSGSAASWPAPPETRGALCS